MNFKELVYPPKQASTPAKIEGRRRPGRNEQVSPQLIPLLRNPATLDLPTLPRGNVNATLLRGALMLVRDILYGLAFGVLLWIGFAVVEWRVWVALS